MKILLILSFLFSLSTYAGDKVRNGGDYVSCNNSRSVNFFYDYYDLLRNKNMKAIFPDIKGDGFAIAHAIISRQLSGNEIFMNLMHSYIEDMKTNIVFHEYSYVPVYSYGSTAIDSNNNPLQQINDNPNIEVHGGCRIGQVAVSGLQNGVWQCEIFKPSWNLMTQQNKSALILHEVIYRLAAANGQTNSVNVIALNQALLANTNPEQLLNLRKNLNLLVVGE